MQNNRCDQSIFEIRETTFELLKEKVQKNFDY